jgi:hypothetical protein
MTIRGIVEAMADQIDHGTFQWVVGGLLGLLSSLGGFWLSHLTLRIDDIGQRQAATEARVSDMKGYLTRIEEKLDVLVQRQLQDK